MADRALLMGLRVALTRHAGKGRAWLWLVGDGDGDGGCSREDYRNALVGIA